MERRDAWYWVIKKKKRHFLANDRHVHSRNVPKSLTGADLSVPTKKAEGMGKPVMWRGLAPITNRAPVVRFLPNIKYFSRDNGMRRNRHRYSRVQFAVGRTKGGSGEGARRVTRFECI